METALLYVAGAVLLGLAGVGVGVGYTITYIGKPRTARLTFPSQI